MSKKRGQKLPPFTALFRHTTNSSAWAALSPGARAAFFELQSNYNTNRQNTVFLSARMGSKKLNAHKDTVTKWLHELEHYGFIVMVQGAHLGVHGTGKAAHYRLTDRPYAGNSPTYDFQNWDGVLFTHQKQNPVRLGRTPRPKKPDIRGEAEMVKSTQKRPTEPDVRNEHDRPTGQDIDSFTSSWKSKGVRRARMVPLARRPPHTQPFETDRAELLKILAQIPRPIPAKLRAVQ
jgi:hypothetical protein